MSNIFIDDNGSGYPFVFVHGFLGSSEMWRYQKEYFKKNYRIISPALPGFGESFKAQSLNSINEMAKFIINIIEQKNIDKTIASARPPIFWKDKDLIKRQIKSWTLNQVKKLILEINEIELLIKTNSQNSIFILSDFILNKSK